ncbi:MAG TPA: hypothetical protein DCD97_03805 [Firmicutes bacterium]|jgi:hypothetical protein|nr:hypothetical protein [Bacillota bacterium]
MLAAKCPGQDRRNWKPEDIFEHDCPHCGAVIEFWKTDVKTRCPECRETVFNPKFNLGCALWCAYAEQCVGDLSGVYTQRPDVLRDKLEMEARKHFIGERARLKYTQEAAEVASRLLEMEKEADPPVIVAAVLLHDAGYAACKKELGDGAELESCTVKKSSEIAGQIMGELKLPRAVQEKVLKIIALGKGAGNGNIGGVNGEVNEQLWHDIHELTRFMLAKADAGNPLPEEKEALMGRLRRESSRRYAQKHI